MITASTPTGIMIEPESGLTINDFVFGVDFFKSLPDYDNPSDLIKIPSISGTPLDPATWLASIQDQVIQQYKDIKANPNMAGFLAAFTSPMIIYGSATIYSAYASQDAFNGRVEIQVSTDGKFYVYGTLNFAKNKISLGSRLYADLSKVASGSVKVLFLANIPRASESPGYFG